MHNSPQCREAASQFQQNAPIWTAKTTKKNKYVQSIGRNVKIQCVK